MKTTPKVRKALAATALSLAVLGTTSFSTAGQAHATEESSQYTKTITKLDKENLPKNVTKLDKENLPKNVTKLDKENLPKAAGTVSK